MIVDEQTGRIMDGRRYSDGLHQAIEAKDVKVELALTDQSHHHPTELLPHVPQVGRHDRTAETEQRSSGIPTNWMWW